MPGEGRGECAWLETRGRFLGESGAQELDERISELLRPSVESLGYELVGVEIAPVGARSTLRLYIDAEDGITLDDCERVSHQVSGVLDVEDPIRGDYALEVSSPGLDRPLFTLEHYRRFVGAEVRVQLKDHVDGRRSLRGRLAGVRGEDVLLIEHAPVDDRPGSGRKRRAASGPTSGSASASGADSDAISARQSEASDRGDGGAERAIPFAAIRKANLVPEPWEYEARDQPANRRDAPARCQ